MMIRKKMLSLMLAVASVPSLSVTCQAAVQSPNPQVTSLNQKVDPRIVAKAKEWFHRFQAAEIDRSQLDVQTNSELTTEMIEHESATLKPFGSPSTFQFIRTYMISGKIAYDFLLQFTKGRIIEMIAFDSDGKIAGIDFMTFVKTNE